MFRAFLKGYFLMQCEKPESRFYKALKIVVRNPGSVAANASTTTTPEIEVFNDTDDIADDTTVGMVTGDGTTK
jgi:hypothetical protein